MFVLWLLLGFSFGCARDLCRCSEIVDFVMHVQWSCNACAIVLVVLHYTLCAGFAKQPHIAQLLHNYCMTIAHLLHNHFLCLAFVQQSAGEAALRSRCRAMLSRRHPLWDSRNGDFLLQNWLYMVIK